MGTAFSAFLIRHVLGDLKTYDLLTRFADYADFKAMHKDEIRRLESLATKLPASMGITKSV